MLQKNQSWINKLKTENIPGVTDSERSFQELGTDLGWRGKEDSVVALWVVDEITLSTRLSFCPSSALWRQFYSLLCACQHALKANKNPMPVVEFILCVFLSKEIRKTVGKVNSKFYRSAEVDLLIGDSSKVEMEVDWVSKKTLEQSYKMMGEAEVDRNRKRKSF